ncbi:TRAP transporter small permease [uncultured Roseibium sp.]|uniref:TRAP transporter small permease n=1 Tax=uncultured Roseibium sp. TaxID=1936171 RepID=UPI003217E69D
MHHPEAQVSYPTAGFRHVDRVLIGLEHIAVWFGIAGLGAIMLLVSADTLGRYFFNAPLQFQYELTSHYLMGMTSLVALSWGVRRGAHIRISLIDDYLGPRLRGLLFGFNFLLAAAVMAVICFYSAAEALRSWSDAEVFFGVVDWPVWLAHIWVPIGCGLLALRLVFDGVLVIVDPTHATLLRATADPVNEVDAV